MKNYIFIALFSFFVSNSCLSPIIVAYKAQLYNNVANVISYEPEKAVDYHLKALNIRLINFGENALITAETYYNLGTAYVKNNNYSDGMVYLNKANEKES